MTTNNNFISSRHKGANQSRIVLVAKKSSTLRTTLDSTSSAESVTKSPLIELLQAHNATIKPLFGKNEERLDSEARLLSDTIGKDVPNLSVYYSVESSESNLERLVDQ